ncbi:MAG: prepilin-type N-terminal cleavage/methylation domain-containing protein [Actinoplanes sp.]
MQDTINRLRNKKADEGFTLIELLVVVVIIGVLVAIAVPVYLNYRKGAADKSAQSDLRGAVSAIEQFYTDNGNKYPANYGPSAANASKVDLPAVQTGGNKAVVTLSDGTLFQLKNDGATYVACTTNTNGTENKYYVYNSNGGGAVKASSATTMANCLADGAPATP